MKYFTVLCMLLTITMGLYAGDLVYPEGYQALGLPEYQNATITDLGRDNSSIRDGFSITLFTTDDGATLRQYYEEEMQSLGWELQETVASTKMRAAGMLDALPFGGVFKKDSMRFQIFTAKKDNGTSIQISVLDD